IAAQPKSRPELEVKLAPNRREHKPYLQWTRSLASTEPLEARTRLGVQAVGEPGWCLIAVGRRSKLADERLRRHAGDLAPGRPEARRVRRDDDHALPVSVLGCEPLEERVCVHGVADRERAEHDLVADSVEDDDAPRALRRDEARERIGQLSRLREAARVEEV